MATRLFLAIEQNHTGVLMTALYDSSNGNAHVRDAMGRTLLIAACEGSVNRDQMVAQLLRDGVDPDAVDDRSRTALHAMCADGQPGDFRVLDLLLEAGIDPMRPDRQGRTALHEFARANWTAGCERLLSNRIDPGILCNARDVAGRTPFMESLPHRSLAMALLSYHADPRVCDQQQRNAFAMTSDPLLINLMQARCIHLDQVDAERARNARNEAASLAECIDMARRFVTSERARNFLQQPSSVFATPKSP